MSSFPDRCQSLTSPALSQWFHPRLCQMSMCVLCAFIVHVLSCIFIPPSPPSSRLLQEAESDLNKQRDSPSEEEPITPRLMSTSQSPKYQLFLSNDLKTNGLSSRDADGPGGGGSVVENGPRPARWENTRLGLNHYRGSLESLASRDWDTTSDRVGEVDCWCVCVCD